MVNWVRRITLTSSLTMWLAIGLLAIATVGVLPNYFTGQWAWSQAPTLSSLKTLRTFQKDGIALSGWHMVDQQTIDLGHKSWSLQALAPASDNTQSQTSTPSKSSAMDTGFLSGLAGVPTDVKTLLQEEPIFIFLRPQSDAKDEPLVEWIDLNGVQRWTMDQRKLVRLNLAPSPTVGSAAATFKTRYFRGWNQSHTYAVMQWYAWPGGGGPKSSDWFWADQWMQWRHHQRMPWVGVTLLVPMKPLGDSSASRPVVEAIAQSVQATVDQQLTAAMNLQG